MKILNTVTLGLAVFLMGTWLFASPYPPTGAADGYTDPTATNTWTADQTYNDDVNLTFGTGGDVDFYFNNATSDFLINPQVAGTGHIQIIESSSGAGTLNTGALNLVQNSGGATGAFLGMYHASGTPDDGDASSAIIPFAKDSGGTARRIGIFRWLFDDVTSTTMDTSMQFQTMLNVNAGNANTTSTLTAAGVWTDAPSFAEFKEPERELTTASVLTKLRSLDVYRFRGKGAANVKETERHISPTADAFYGAFKAGKDPRINRRDGTPQYGIAARDVAGVALMAIQELIKVNDKLKGRIDALETN